MRHLLVCRKLSDLISLKESVFFAVHEDQLFRFYSFQHIGPIGSPSLNIRHQTPDIFERVGDYLPCDLVIGALGIVSANRPARLV